MLHVLYLMIFWLIIYRNTVNKETSDILKKAMFNDCGYRLLSLGVFASTAQLKSFDKTDKANLPLYNDKAYKIIEADRVFDIRLYEEVTLKNGKTKDVKSKALLKQKSLLHFPEK